MSRTNSLTDLTLSQASALLQEGSVSPVELVNACLDRIAATEGLVRAFAALVPDRALHDAERAERELASGKIRSPLHGIPVALKDLIETRGIRTTAGSRILENWVPERNATVAQRLDDAGTVLLGKVTTHEFAMDVFTPPTRNPWDLDRMPGGSSGGSAAAVAASMCFGAIGTDTAGSVRIPAALCGVSGLKPTYGRVSRAGVVPFSWSLDHVGPIARSASDLALLLEAIAGWDPRDPSSARQVVPHYASELEDGLIEVRIGVPREFFFDRVDGEVVGAFEAAIAVLEGLGAQVAEVSIPTARMAPIVGDVISFPEVSVYHRRWLRERPDDYSASTRANLELGELILATDYVQAQRVRALIVAEFLDVLQAVDALAVPTTPAVAIHVGERTVTVEGGAPENALDAFCRLTYAANVTGLPALTIPCGSSAEGLPIGLQLIGRPYEEGRVLRVGWAYQEVTDWHTRLPPLDTSQR